MIPGWMTRIPSSPTAPMPSSGWNGTPSLRTMMTSSGAPSARATCDATGTPPRGRPSRTTGSPRRCRSLAASRRPASSRSAKAMTTLVTSFLAAGQVPLGTMVTCGPAPGCGRAGRASGTGQVSAGRAVSFLAGMRYRCERPGARLAALRGVDGRDGHLPPGHRRVHRGAKRAGTWAFQPVSRGEQPVHAGRPRPCRSIRPGQSRVRSQRTDGAGAAWLASRVIWLPIPDRNLRRDGKGWLPRSGGYRRPRLWLRSEIKEWAKHTGRA